MKNCADSLALFTIQAELSLIILSTIAMFAIHGELEFLAAESRFRVWVSLSARACFQQIRTAKLRKRYEFELSIKNKAPAWLQRK